MKKQSLKEIREKLRKKDREIIKLLNERTELSIEVGKAKNSQGWEAYDPSQEGRSMITSERSTKAPCRRRP